MVNAGLLGLIAAPTYRMLQDTTQRAFIDVLVQNKIPFTFNKSDKELVLKDTQSHILFRTLDAPERLRGTTLAWWAIDEMAFTTEHAFTVLQARLSDPRAKELTGIAATTPNGLNFVYDYFLGEKKTDDFEMVRAVPGENWHLPPDYYESLARTYDPRFYRQEILGEYLNLTSGTAYHAFERNRNLDASIAYDPACRLFLSMDFNIDPMCSVIGQIRNAAVPDGTDVYGRPKTKTFKTMEIIDESPLRDATVNQACDEFIAKTQSYVKPEQRLMVNVYGDSAGNARSHAGKSDWQMVYEHFARFPQYKLNTNIPSANPLVRDRVNAMNGALYSATGEIRVTIHPRCKTLIRDLERVVWKRDSNKNMTGDLDKSDPQLTHMSDALGYAISKEFPLANKVWVGVF